MSFKIIAIKTGNEDFSSVKTRNDEQPLLNVNHLKVLKKKTIYCFNNHYTFSDKNDFSEITYDSKNDIDLYSLILSNGKKIPVNISAIVGENGCGKSTLIELLYWMNYNVGCYLLRLETYDEEAKKSYSYNAHNKLDLELLYQTDKNYHIIKFVENNNGNASIQQLTFSLEKDKYKQPNNPNWQDISKQDLSNFFYSIVVNYSFYALNSDEIGNWIIPLFHKNDGYQTPIVLNPMRTQGTINVNRERQLLSRRLQSNIFEPIGKDIKVEDSLRNLANGKITETLLIKKSNSYESDQIANFEKKYKSKLISALENVFSIDKNQSYDGGFNHFTLLYIYTKLKKMTEKYSQLYGGKKALNDFNTLLETIKNTKSHTAFKVKGAILHLKYYDEIYRKLAKVEGAPKNRIFNPIDDKFTINIEEYSTLIEDIKGREKNNFDINTYMMAFPSFFDVEIQPKKKEEKYKDDCPIDSFSSGEKQRINSLSSIVYHIINLNSVEETTDIVHYKYINIILDEIELYYHPEWQRTFIADMLAYLSKINPDNLNNIKGINIIFVTHSPFILSDIPSSHIIRLENGKIKENKETFGANIHDLLADSFFMPKGFMGEFAKEKINSAIEWLEPEEPKENEEWNKDKLLNFINMIGEPLIKNSLKNLYFEHFPDKEMIQKEIEKLNALLTEQK